MDEPKFGAIPRVNLGALNMALYIAIALGLISPNPLESAFVIMQLKFILYKEWKQNIPPVTVLLFLFPWLDQ